MKTPSVLLIVTGILTILSGVTLLVLAALIVMAGDPFVNSIANIVLGLGSMAGGAFIAFGGLKANKLESRTLVMVACVAACLPLCSVCCMPLGLVAGIWGLVAANKLEDEFNS